MLGALAQRVIQSTGRGLAKSVQKLPAAIAPKVSEHASKHSIKLAGESITHGVHGAQSWFHTLLKPVTFLKTLFQNTLQMFGNIFKHFLNLGQKLFKKS